MLPIILLQPRAKLLQLPQQAKRRTLNLQHRCFGSGWHYDGRVAWLSGEHGHLSETGLLINLADLVAYSLVIVDVNIEFAIDQNVEGVPAPVALMDDLFTGAVHQQTRIRPNLLAGIVAAIDKQFQIQLVLEVILMSLN